MKSHLLASAALAACIVITVTPTKAAAAQQQAISIPAGELKSALDKYVQQTGRQLIYRPDQLRGARSPGAHGNLTPDAALQAVLSGTGFVARTDATGAIAIVSAVGNAPSGAQAAAEAAPTRSASDSTIFVTGTRVRGNRPVGSEALVFDRDDFDKLGVTTAPELFRNLPQNVGLGANETTGNTPYYAANSNVAYGSGVNLRGIGPDATLTLVNGRRLARGGFGSFVDIAGIPMPAVQRVEILLDGASAIYGSDAIGGVVNFIMSDNFKGAESQVQLGAADGYQRVSAALVLGTTWASGSVLLSYEYYDRDALAASSRDFFRSDLRDFGGSDFRRTEGNPGNIIGNDGTIYGIPSGQNGRALTADQLLPNQPNLQDAFLGSDILPSQKRHSFYGQARQSLSDTITLNVSGFYARRETFKRENPPTATFIVPSSNPFFVSPDPGADFAVVQYSFLNELGAVTSRSKTITYSATAGLLADIGRSWRGEVHATYSRDQLHTRADNLVNFAGLDAALADPDPATAFNPFGEGSNSPQATIDSIRGFYEYKNYYGVSSADAQANGPLFQLPAGAVKLAVGGELRHEQYVSDGVTFFFAEPELSNARLSRNVAAGFAELLVPIFSELNARRGIERLTLSLAGRFERYSDFGSTSNPKVGLEWAPILDLTLRGSVGTSFKAPLFNDLDTRSGFSFDFLLADPQSPSGTSQSIIVAGGNPDLKPETATTWSVGANWKPRDVRGLSLKGTYYSILYNNRIENLPFTQVFGVLANEAVFAPRITRNPSIEEVKALLSSPQYGGSPIDPATVDVIIDARLKNIAILKVRGIDMLGTYDFNLLGGTTSASLEANLITDYVKAQSKSAPKANFVGTVGNPPKLRARAGLAWGDGHLSASAFVNYVHHYRNTLVIPAERISSWITADARLAYTTGATVAQPMFRGITLSLSAQNIFGRDPPFVNNPVGYGYDPSNASPDRRVVTLELRKTW